MHLLTKKKTPTTIFATYANAIIRNKLIKQINSTHAAIVQMNNFGHKYINVFFFCSFDQRETDLQVLVIWQIDAIETMALSHHLPNMLLPSNEHDIGPLPSFSSSDFDKRGVFSHLSARIVLVPSTLLAFSLSSKDRDVNQLQKLSKGVQISESRTPLIFGP